MNSRISVAIGLGAWLFVGAANAHGQRFTMARVTGVEPVYETIVVETPVTTCHREIVERHVSRPSVAGQTLAGAIIGAAIGRQFGGGSGRDALTMIGAAAGSAVANERAVRRHRGAPSVAVIREPVERCATEFRQHSERRVTGYWVDYRHRGRNYRILSPERPGRQLRIAVGS